ncbi:endonuclease/exonuclease/phosphatase family protein [Luteolibacter ambystomatis]|uniref:endonuclease/exonuclease/phosphatase family protein n=1 Tax=Luteolibacter ambystomatis TaxID=2824561 RepID=UPI0036257C51
MAGLLGYELPRGETTEPGLIVLQVDGLSRRQLEKAMEDGRVPFLRKLVRRGHFQLESFYSGLPSTTPAVQAELFYGKKSAVPSFQFLDRATGKLRRMYEADSASDVEDELRRECGKPLLDGAHAYSDIYVAGAARSWFCSRDFALREIWKRVNVLKWLVLSALYFVKLLRIAGLAAVELVLAFVDVARGLFRNQDLRKELSFVPMRVIICSVVREFIRLHILLDIERGVRVIHANFLGYDEQAHRRGPGSAFAHWTLKGLDRTIRDIHHAAMASSYRDYEIVVYSDHGQEKTVPFARTSGRPLAEVVGEALSTGPASSFPVWTPAFPTVVGSTWDRCRGLLQREVPLESMAATCDPEKEIILTALGPIGHIYLPVKLGETERAMYATRLVEGGVPLVLLPAADGVIRAFDREGSWTLPGDERHLIGEDHPFLKEATEDLVGLCQHPNAGDLLVSGWRPGIPPVSFVLENGGHGGPGSEETHGFVLVPDRLERWHRGLRAGCLRPAELRSMLMRYLDLSSEEAVAHHTTPANGTLKVVTYNVHSCRGIDGKVRPERIARVINQLDPDVVALQEVDVHRLRTGHADQALAIARHLRMEHSFYSVLEEGSEGYGIAVFSKQPFEIQRSALLTQAARGKEARGAIWIKLPASDGRPAVHFINTHFGLARRERIIQAGELLGDEWLGAVAKDEPAILCGDFNSVPSSRVWQRLNERLPAASQGRTGQVARPTFPAHRPLLRLDHVFASSDLEVENVIIPSTPTSAVASDHLPLCVEFKIPTE